MITFTYVVISRRIPQYLVETHYCNMLISRERLNEEKLMALFW